jgi:hypothetical protein
MDAAKEWPLPGRRLAWAPGPDPALSAVPFSQGDAGKPMTETEWLALLAWRVAWMVEREADPEEGYRLLVQEFVSRDLAPAPDPKLSLRSRVEHLMADPTGAWRENHLGLLDLGDWPQTVKADPEAVEAIEETTLAEWMDLVFSPALDLT